MRMFFIKALSLILGVSLLFNMLGSLADRIAPLDDWRIEHRQRLATLQSGSDRIEAVTLGNSHSDSLDYPTLGVQGLSLAFAAADLFEIEKYAASLDGKLPHLKTVFIAVSYYSFSRDNAKFESLKSRRIGFYSLVPVGSPIRGDALNFVLGKLESSTHVMSVVRSDNWKGVWTGFLTDAPSMDAFPYDGVQTTSTWGGCSHYTPEQLDSHAQEIARRNVSSSMQMVKAHAGLEQDSLDALARTIERFQSRGIRVVLYTPAYYEKYTIYFEAEGAGMIDQMKRAVDQLQKTFGVKYYDFSRDVELIYQPELFYNSDHLNECGRKVLSANLLEKMGEPSTLEVKNLFQSLLKVDCRPCP